MIELPKEAELPLPPILPESVGDITVWDARLYFFEHNPSEILEWAEQGIMPLKSALTILQMRSNTYAELLNDNAIRDSLYIPAIDYRITREDAREKIGAEDRAIILLRGKLPPPSIVAPISAPQAPNQIIDTVKQATLWLKNKQYIFLYTEPEKPFLEDGGIKYIEPPKKEWRICRARTVAFIYRALLEASEKGEIHLGKDAISNFMINNLKDKNGADIKRDPIYQAEKSREIPSNFQNVITASVSATKRNKNLRRKQMVLFSVKEAARELGISVISIRRKVRSG
jgi:hypothetical protein